MTKKEYNKMYHEKNKEKISLRTKAFRKTHRKEANDRSKQYYINNTKHVLARQKGYREINIKNGTSVQGWVLHKYNGIPCLDCNMVYPFCVMDFDHRPEETKSFSISRVGAYKATSDRISTVMKEIDKCDLICANCHRIRTWITRLHK